MKNIILISLMFVSPAFAGTKKIIFNLKGVQHFVEVDQTGGVTSEAQIVWDESRDGPLPKDAPIGYASRSVDQSTGKISLDADMNLLAIKQAAEQKEIADAAKKAQDKADCDGVKDRFKTNKDDSADLKRFALCVINGLVK